MKKILKLVLFSNLFLYSFSSSAQATCDASLVPPITLPNGINVTSTFTGDVTGFQNPYTSCGGVVTTPANSIYLGQTGSYTYTLNFSQSVNNLVVNITGTGQAVNEFFTFTTNMGNPTITTNNSCFSVITGNTIASGLNSTQGGGGGGGTFLITAPNNFTQITVSGPGGVAGSLLSFCQNALVQACDNNITLSSPINDVNNLSLPIIGRRHRQAVNWISASNVVTIGDNAANNGVVYHAGDFVELTPGFEVINGSQFVAYPEGCSNNYLYRNQDGSIKSDLKYENRSDPTEYSTKSIVINPNPSSNSIEILMRKAKFKKVSIATIDGKMVFEGNSESTDKLSIDVSTYANGIYIVTVISDEGQQFSKKLIKN